MSAAGLVMDALLIVLILGAIGFGLRLEKKLAALRDGQAGFAAAVAELNVAAGRAEAALAELRAAGEETDLLHERIVAARTLKAELLGLTTQGRKPVQAPPETEAESSPARLLQALTERRLTAEPIMAAPVARPPAARPEDDLFEPVRRRA